MDGDPVTREAYAAALAEAGYVVERAATRAIAVTRAREMRPTVIVMERALPDGDGWSIVSYLRRIEGMQDVPVIALATSESDLKGSLLAGCDAFLEKPCEAEVLVLQVRRLVALRSPRTTGPRKRIDRE